MNAPSPVTTTANTISGLPIAAVERETGLAKDTLRVWEKRYGFPQPLRDAHGNRLYPAQQVHRLQLVRRLLDVGMRPNKVVGLEPAALLELLGQHSSKPQTPALPKTKRPAAFSPASPAYAHNHEAELAALLNTIAAHDPQGLRHALQHAQMRMGLAPFILNLVAPLTVAVGEAWAQGRFEVFEEHLYTEVLSGVLRQAISSLTALPPSTPATGPKVLLTTLPQELHSLGLLMVEALLTLDGCTCISLGTQTPLLDIVQAAQAHNTDVVALSFTATQSGALVQASLRELRTQLAPQVALWVGGACPALYQKPLPGITAMQPLSGLKQLTALWRTTHPRSQTTS